MSIDLVIDFDKPASKARLWALLRTLDGKHRVEIKRHNRNRTLPQNSYYFGVVVREFQKFLHEQGDSYTIEDCHEILKFRHLRESVVDHSTGEIIGERVRSTASLTTTEFAEYVDLCASWLGDMFGITIPTPDSE